MPTIHSPLPVFSLADATDIARSRFGLGGELTPLAGERDLNFRVAASDSRDAGFVLKIAHAGESRQNLELQHAALARLAEREPGLALQRVVPTQDGEGLIEVEARDGQRHWARLLTFLPGRLWSEVCARRRPSAALLARLGATLGTIDRGLTGLDADINWGAARRELKWDLRQAGWIRDYLGYLDGHPDAGPRRALVEGWLADFDFLSAITAFFSAAWSTERMEMHPVPVRMRDRL